MLAMPKGIYGNRNWTEEQDTYLADNWGRVSDKTVARHLSRTVDACKVRATRHLGLCRTMNIYTAREVARIFGVDSKLVVKWGQQDYLKVRRSPVRCGATRRWDVDDASIKRLIKGYPWLYDRKRIDRFDYTVWRNMAEEAWDRDPMLTVSQAAVRLQVHEETLRRHIRMGQIKAHRVHWLGNDAGAYLIPSSALPSFSFLRPVWLSLGCAADKYRLLKVSRV